MSGFLQILRCILCCSDEDHHERDYETWERDPLLTSSYYSSSVRNSSSNNNDLLRQRDPTKIYYYEYYPNVSISSPTTKKPSVVSQQSEHGKSSLNRTNEQSQSLKNSKPSTPSSSYYKCPSSPKSPQSLPKVKPSPSNPSLSSTESSSFPKPSLASSKPFSTPGSSSPSQSLSSPKPTSFTSDQHQFSRKPTASSRKPSQPTLFPLASESTNQQTKDSYWFQKGTSNYKIPKDIEDLIKKDIVPDVLKKPLSPSTYKDFFATLLYAEDFYCEKWSGFQLLKVTLEVQEASLYDKSLKNKHLKKSDQKDDKLFVAFRIDSVPGRLPFLLSRDFVHAQRSGGKSKKFQGLLNRVVKSTTVLVEFEECFHSEHHPSYKYDISFSFNRVCLKRAHQAIAAASDPLFQNCLFPDCASRKIVSSSSTGLYSNYKLNSDINSAVHWILSSEGQPPYLVEGPLCVSGVVLSETGIVVREAVVQICQTSPNSRILICAPTNRTCDVLTESLMEDIPESDMFRANAAFREAEEVPDDILQVSLLKGMCFSCPSLLELRQYRVIFSTFVSSFRLHDKGISAGHFTHIFLVDASSAIEPETVIALNNLANENTTVIVTGAPHNYPGRVRSDIARKNGLKMSYFERLRQTKTYRSCDAMFFKRLSTSRKESDSFRSSRKESDSFRSFSYIDL